MYNSRQLQMVSDIYSTDNYLNINTESFTIQTNFQSLNFQERVSGTNSIDENALFIDEVLGNCCNDIVIANSRLNRDVLIVDGLATTTVLYRNNETNSVVPYTMQVPFSIDLKIGNVKDNSQVCVNAKLTKVSVKCPRLTRWFPLSLLSWVSLNFSDPTPKRKKTISDPLGSHLL